MIYNVINLRIQEQKGHRNTTISLVVSDVLFVLECSEKYFVRLLYKYILCDIIVVRGDVFVCKNPYQKICW